MQDYLLANSLIIQEGEAWNKISMPTAVALKEKNKHCKNEFQ